MMARENSAQFRNDRDQTALKKRRSHVTCLLLLTFLCTLLHLPTSFAQTPGNEAATELVVGTKEAPPFAMKDAKGEWSGVGIELWKQVALKLKRPYRFVEADSVASLLDRLEAGEFDVAVAAITVTSARERRVDFSWPYFQTGTGIAVQTNLLTSWTPVIRSVLSYSFAQAVLALLGLAFVAGLLIWYFERGVNEGLRGGLAKGISSGVWWSTNAMTQRMGGGLVPVTLPGRIVATIWMVVSVVAIAVFTAGITSALTSKRLNSAVNSFADLTTVRVGVIEGTATQDALTRLRIKHNAFPTVKEGFAALQRGRIDALTYDRPILAWMIRQDRRLQAELADFTFEPQSYAIALRPNRPLRKEINVALLEIEQSDWWKDVLFRYLGQTPN